MAPLHGINARACAGADHLRQLQRPPAPRTAAPDTSAVAAAFTQQLNASLLKGVGSTGESDERSSDDDGLGLGGGGGLGGLDAAGALGSIGALRSPNSLGSLLGMPGGMGSMASMPGLGTLASLGSLIGGTSGGGMQGQLVTTLLQALGSANLLGQGAAAAEPLATPCMAAGAGASLVQPAPASQSARQNAQTVAEVARKLGVPEDLAVAMMLVESGGNGRAVGDGGTSFGLFQLHKGGMLTSAGLTPEQAFDPRTNASVALRSLASELGKGGNRSVGEIAAASQRPADKEGYARKVNASLEQARNLISGPGSAKA